MRRLKVFYYDYFPESFLNSLSSFKCELDLVSLEDLQVECIGDIKRCDLVVVVLPKHGYFDYEDLFKYLGQKYDGRIFVLDHSYQQRNRMLCMYYGADLYFSLPMSVADFYKYVSYYSFSNLYDDEILNYKDITLDISRRKVTRSNREFDLRNKEFELLTFLLKNPGRVLSKQRILEEVWDMNADTNTTTVESHMSTLRKKIDSDYDEKYIQTVYCVGYKVE